MNSTDLDVTYTYTKYAVINLDMTFTYTNVIVYYERDLTYCLSTLFINNDYLSMANTFDIMGGNIIKEV